LEPISMIRFTGNRDIFCLKNILKKIVNIIIVKIIFFVTKYALQNIFLE